MTMQRPPSRRDFLASSLSAAVASPFLLSGLASAAQPRRTNANDRITMGLIGCGGMGNANLNSFLGQDDVQVVAVCDPDAGRRAASKNRVEQRYAAQTRSGTFNGCTEYNDFRELLERDDIDAVIQATPDHWHAPIVVAAARAGKDIYGEKPLSLTIRDGRVMADTVRDFGRVFQTGSQQRSDGRFRLACELVRNGRIGTVHSVTCGLPTTPTCPNQPPIPVPEGFDYDLWLGPAPWAPYCARRTHFDFRWILDYSGGQVTDWGAHHIDIAHWGLGLEETGPVSVEGSGDFPRDGLFDAATNFDFTAAYRTGVKIRITNGFENGVRWEGDDGWIFVSRGRIDASSPDILKEQLAPWEDRLPRSPGHHRDFLNCMRTRSTPIAPIEQAHRTITVAHLGNIAMQLERPVQWDPDSERILGDWDADRMMQRAARGNWGV